MEVNKLDDTLDGGEDGEEGDEVALSDAAFLAATQGRKNDGKSIVQEKKRRENKRKKDAASVRVLLLLTKNTRRGGSRMPRRE